MFFSITWMSFKYCRTCGGLYHFILSIDRVGIPFGFQTIIWTFARHLVSSCLCFPATGVTWSVWTNHRPCYVSTFQFLPAGLHGLFFGYCPLPLHSLINGPLFRVRFGESLVVTLYSEIYHIHLSIGAQCVMALLPLGDCHIKNEITCKKGYFFCGNKSFSAVEKYESHGYPKFNMSRKQQTWAIILLTGTVQEKLQRLKIHFFTLLKCCHGCQFSVCKTLMTTYASVCLCLSTHRESMGSLVSKIIMVMKLAYGPVHHGYIKSHI